MASAPLRAVVIGARSTRAGTGQYLARFLDGAGVHVVGVCASTAKTGAIAAEALGDLRLTKPSPFGTAAEMCRATHPDIVVIASPDETHAEYLQLALEHDAHVLCEKPVCWGAADSVETALRLGSEIRNRGRHLVINAQWPCTLPTWQALIPDVDPAAATSFFMRMSPRTIGRDSLPAALPHPLALLLAVAPDGPTAIQDVDLRRDTSGPERIDVRFGFEHARGAVACHVELVHTPDQPRPAGYGFDGHVAWREVELPSYRMRLTYGDGSIPMPDPTPLLVRSFVDRIKAGVAPEIDPSLDPGMAHLATLAAAWDAPSA